MGFGRLWLVLANLYRAFNCAVVDMSVQKLEAQLRACTDSFVNLVRAARIGDDTASTKRTKVAQALHSAASSCALSPFEPGIIIFQLIKCRHLVS